MTGSSGSTPAEAPSLTANPDVDIEDAIEGAEERASIWRSATVAGFVGVLLGAIIAAAGSYFTARMVIDDARQARTDEAAAAALDRQQERRLDAYSSLLATAGDIENDLITIRLDLSGGGVVLPPHTSALVADVERFEKERGIVGVVGSPEAYALASRMFTAIGPAASARSVDEADRAGSDFDRLRQKFQALARKEVN